MDFRGVLMVFVVALVQLGLSFPSGAPKLACKSMTPLHGVNAQNATSPFTITLSATSIKSPSLAISKRDVSDVVNETDSTNSTVSTTSTSTTSTTTTSTTTTTTSTTTTTEASTSAVSIEDHQITVSLSSPDQKAFKGFFVQARNSKDQSVGTFKVVKGPGAFLDCGKGAHSTVTHANRNAKTSVVLKWSPPENFEGEIVFHASVVEEFTVFHTGIKSSTLTVSKSS